MNATDNQKQFRITICPAQNGVVVEACACESYDGPRMGRPTDYKYVYKDIKSAVKELPSLYDVMMEGGMPDTRSIKEKNDPVASLKEPEEDDD